MMQRGSHSRIARCVVGAMEMRVRWARNAGVVISGLGHVIRHHPGAVRKAKGC